MRLQLYILFLVGLFQLVLSQDNLHSSGNYLIRYCPAEKVSQLELLIPAFQTHLHKVVSDVTMGTRSNAYRTFFKSLAMIAPVHRVLSRMEEGDVVLNPGSGPPFERLRHPAILCFDRSIPLWEGVDGLCDGGAYAAVVPGRELVVLCDLFWNLPYEPSHEMQCPHVRRNRFFPNDHRIADNKFGVFVHEFAHVYLSNWDTDYAFSLMDAARRDTDRSLTNPSNFALYASMVVADCEHQSHAKPLFLQIGTRGKIAAAEVYNKVDLMFVVRYLGSVTVAKSLLTKDITTGGSKMEEDEDDEIIFAILWTDEPYQKR
ncbi:MAG: hypothetical protein L6R41_003997 [Letrouitia leprolyta]|nr:MAG: hypothetical protein L6R41_003997 [Letrouitia leprolyta]